MEETVCPCKLKAQGEAADTNGGLHSLGTVIDRYMGLKGTVEKVSADELVLSASGPGPRVQAILKPGFKGIFDGLEPGQTLFCVISVLKALPDEREAKSIYGVCFLIVRLTTRVTTGGRDEWEDRLFSPELPEQVRQYSRGLMMDYTRSAACVIAIFKALRVESFQKRAVALIKGGYIPAGIECQPREGQTGLINVLFAFKNLAGDIQVVAVPVSLQSWVEVDVDAAGALGTRGIVEEEVEQFSAKRWPPHIPTLPKPWCRIACRTAQAACVAACPASGPAAALCVAACIAAGEECLRRC